MRPYLERATQLARDGMDETRQMLRDLRTPEPSHTDLAEALHCQFLRLTAGTGTHISVQVRGRQTLLPPVAEFELMRIGQETVTNAIRHGKARYIKVTLVYASDGVRLLVRNDGLSPNTAAMQGRTGGLGLTGMRERLEKLKGTLTVESRGESGVMVTAFVPYPVSRSRAR